MNNSGSEFPASDQPPQDGLKMLPPKRMPGFANHVVIIGKGDAIKAVTFEEAGNDGGGPGDTTEEH